MMMMMMMMMMVLGSQSSPVAPAPVLWAPGGAGYWNGSLVAVKVLEQVAGDFNPRSSLEPLLHHRMSHPNIVAMFDVCTQVKGMAEGRGAERSGGEREGRGGGCAALPRSS
jgi:hypothetical protein